MPFFRFRFVNTVLIFLLGILVGFIFKERSGVTERLEDAQPRYQPEYESGQPAAADALEDQDLPDTARQDEETARPGFGARPQPDREPEISVEPVKAGERAPAPRTEAALVEPAVFFKATASYSGREIEMPLQMITAKKAGGGWRLNFAYMDAEKRLNYLYVDDPGGLLGAKPDLRIGYQYRVRFTCGGAADAGNALTSVLATGEKADWATGMSAVEP